jgi:endonuclease/exonuclease/phosphatase family metal-dependent hydrolase
VNRSRLAGAIGLALILASVLIAPALRAALPGQAIRDLRVMSFNIRYGTADDGDDAWSYRHDFVADVIRDFGPQVLGTQEALDFQVAFLEDAFPEYRRVGVGRSDGVADGEFAAIFVDRTRLDVVKEGTFWFSDTPETPGSMSWGNRITRICTWVRLLDRESGRHFYAYNVHWDHESQESRERSAALLIERIGSRAFPDEPFVIMGDFNAGEANPAFRALLEAPSPRIVDTYREARPDEPQVGTFNGFRGEVDGEKIDAVLASDGWRTVTADIARTSRAGRTPSDHFPVTAVLTADPIGGAPETVGAGVRPTIDPVARLLERIDAGSATLEFDSATGWLGSVLRELDVPVSSQTLVFSRTSLQTDLIGPWAPRALYFNDDVYVGFVQDGGIIELGSVMPTGGAAFYSLSQQDADEPAFVRETTTCLMCHESRSVTGGVPGFIMRSVLTDRLGYPIGEVHEGLTTARTPIERRWGGWYLTDADDFRHAGNAYAGDLRADVGDVRRYVEEFDFSASREVVRERGLDVSPYLTPHSDVVALLVLMHQVEVHNLISLVHEAAGTALRESGFFSEEEAAAAAFEELRSGGQTRVTAAVERLVDAMLFVREVPFETGPSSVSGFRESFEALGPRDSKGRSLRDLDLESRTFRYPLSFLIYSDAFATIPPVAKTRIHSRLSDILAGAIVSEAYDHLTPELRRAISEILTETLDLEIAGGVEERP